MIEARLRADTQHAIKAVCVVHNETSTGVTSNIAAVRRAIDAAGHPALAAGRHHLGPRVAPTIAMTNGASTSPCPVRKRA